MSQRSPDGREAPVARIAALEGTLREIAAQRDFALMRAATLAGELARRESAAHPVEPTDGQTPERSDGA